MNTLVPRSLGTATLLSVCLCGWTSPSSAQVSGLAAPANLDTQQDGWLIQRDVETGPPIHVREMTLHPSAEPRPALKYRLLPDDFDILEGNAAIYYLKAMGFFEQTRSQEELHRVREEAWERAQKEGKTSDEVPPHVWLSTPPDELPLDEVKAYLRLTAFQPTFIREAARRDRCDLDRDLHEIDNPFGYPLSEVGSMRELERTQSLRCRVAIAEGRIDDAVVIIGQQFALARHLAQDDFLVRYLIGAAIVNTASNDALYLLEHADTPNLYWALTTMPTPLVDIQHSMNVEREFLYLQLKVLREVDETPRSVGYWQEFLDRVLLQLGDLGTELKLPAYEDDPQLARAALVACVAAAYPGAKEYLLEECKLDPKQVEAYPTTQVVFLAMVRFYEQWRDETSKWSHLPLWQVRANANRNRVHRDLDIASNRYDWCTAPANEQNPTTYAHDAHGRCEQKIALLQTIEAIRMYGAAHDGQLPPSLDELPVPAAIESLTGKPVEYEFHGTHAVLNAHETPGLRYRLVLRMAKQAE